MRRRRRGETFPRRLRLRLLRAPAKRGCRPKGQDRDRQVAYLLAAAFRRDDLYTDRESAGRGTAGPVSTRRRWMPCTHAAALLFPNSPTLAQGIPRPRCAQRKNCPRANRSGDLGPIRSIGCVWSATSTRWIFEVQCSHKTTRPRYRVAANIRLGAEGRKPMTTIQATFMVTGLVLVPASAFMLTQGQRKGPRSDLPGRRGRLALAGVVGALGVALVLIAALVPM